MFDTASMPFVMVLASYEDLQEDCMLPAVMTLKTMQVWVKEHLEG